MADVLFFLDLIIQLKIHLIFFEEKLLLYIMSPDKENVYLFFHYTDIWVLIAAKSLQSCPTLCDPIDGSLPGSSVPGIY